MRYTIIFFIISQVLFSQNIKNDVFFSSIEEKLPSPNNIRTASGRPGPDYWQIRVDYDMDIQLNEDNQTLTGSEVITFHNNSPHALPYLWIQLDQNIFEKHSLSNTTKSDNIPVNIPSKTFQTHILDNYNGGFEISQVADKSNNDLIYTKNNTMMRVELPQPLALGKSYVLKIQWKHRINNHLKVGGRCGYEFFEKDSNYIFEIAQFFPRAAVYSDVTGWQNRQFLGDAEFALPFGDYKVSVSVPKNHIVAATGMCTNLSSVLEADQYSRFKKAQESNEVVQIVTKEEALDAEEHHYKKLETWKFEAKNVRDFAFASSRKFMWQAKSIQIGKNKTLAMSYYPKEGDPLWGKYAVHSVAHALSAYSKYSVDYPYPQCSAVHGSVFGMEYPMINFNGGRPNEDGSYTEKQKISMISVIIHEVGHNFFPMIINSDEREWAWMDEGFNSFVEYLVEQEWYENYPSRRGPSWQLDKYLKSSSHSQESIMTQPDVINQLGNNAYGKVATGLNILRETILGRELFDYAFGEYCKAWAFKSPTPADFFRIMEDASGMTLDWFWRGWFYENLKVDLAIEKITIKTPVFMKDSLTEKEFVNITVDRNKTAQKPTYISLHKDLYDKYDSLNLSLKKTHSKDTTKLTKEQIEISKIENFYYEITFKNKGGMIFPLPLLLVFEDDTKEDYKIPAEIWRKNTYMVTKVLSTTKKLKKVVLDPYNELPDGNYDDNVYPSEISEEKFWIY